MKEIFTAVFQNIREVLVTVALGFQVVIKSFKKFKF